jgi:hypothetical protein
MESKQCFMCENYRYGKKCNAFPRGIPSIVFSGEHDHREPYKGDNGIRFEPIKENKST